MIWALVAAATWTRPLMPPMGVEWLQRRAAEVSALARRLYDEGAERDAVVAAQRASANLYAIARFENGVS